MTLENFISWKLGVRQLSTKRMTRWTEITFTTGFNPKNWWWVKCFWIGTFQTELIHHNYSFFQQQCKLFFFPKLVSISFLSSYLLCRLKESAIIWVIVHSHQLGYSALLDNGYILSFYQVINRLPRQSHSTIIRYGSIYVICSAAEPWYFICRRIYYVQQVYSVTEMRFW
jgi:hypothetical protein